MKFSFETLHKNHKWAFVDGLLCGLVAYHYARKIQKAKQETNAFYGNFVEVVEVNEPQTINE